MAAFDKISSGLAGLDLMLDSIRLGDNVVWQVGSVDDYRRIVQPFAAQALRDGRVLIYIRFAPHAPLLEPTEGLTIRELDPFLGFEHFTGEVHRIIADAGLDAFYVFDCLSELQTAWAADLMMGNFFSVTCPYLFELDTVAWFCLLRHRHSYDAIARIRETTQILLALYPDDGFFYVHPIKVWKRYAPTMFFPHRLDLANPDDVRAITDGVSVSRFYRLAETSGDSAGTGDLDSWERFFIDARKAALSEVGASVELIEAMAARMIGTDERVLALVDKYCTAQDLLAIKDRMIGSGKIGGKSVGLILSRTIVRRTLAEISSRIEPHDSFYIGSDVFYTYLVHNRLWKLRIQQRTREGYLVHAPALKQGLSEGTFPDRIREQFLRTLEYFGQAPIIVRSSSLLEDSFGHAFAGKYESVFCANSGSPEDRLAAFENAVRAVYASTMDESALAYRKLRGLQDQDEQMAILVQRVSGSLFRDFFMPSAAGVGYSLNAWKWHPDIDPKAGMVRLVIGLGTRAVDRTDSDYPRLVSLDKPELDPSAGGDRAQYCQRSVDGLDLGGAGLSTRTLESILPDLPPWLADMLTERDLRTESALAESGQSRVIRIGTCPGVVAQKALMADLGSIMRELQTAYGCPVDIEFTVNWSSVDDYLVNLLQCRPLQAAKGSRRTEDSAVAKGMPVDETAVAAVARKDLFFFLRRDTMGPQLDCRLDIVIIVDPQAYCDLPYRDKPAVARAIGALNERYGASGTHAMLLSPGRLGTSSPELGVPVSFAEIDHFSILAEVAWSKGGYRPELSFGSHFFQDLVESEIFYAAIPESDSPSIFNPDFLNDEKDLMETIMPETTLPAGLIRVYEPKGLFFRSDLVRGSCLCARLKL
jgi:hypothetical protein